MKQQRAKIRAAWQLSVLMLPILLAGSGAFAADGAGPPLPEAAALDEVEVVGKSFARMRKDIEKTEDRFYELYNQLNNNQDFTVYCVDHAPLGTRIKKRVCEPAFYAKVRDEQAKQLLDGLNAMPPESVWLARRDDYYRNMVQIVRQNPQLQQLLLERNELEQRFETTRKEWFKDHWMHF